MIEHTSAGTNPLEADRLFHIRVAEATGNSVLVGLVTQLFDARLGPLFNRLHSHFDTIEVWNDAIEEHSRVMKALRARDPEMARAAMRRHMDIAFKRYSASLVGQAGLFSKKVVAEKAVKAVKAKVVAKKPAAKESAVKVVAKKSAKSTTVKQTSALKASAKRAPVATPTKRRSARAGS
jgi:hypothetical protein